MFAFSFSLRFYVFFIIWTCLWVLSFPREKFSLFFIYSFFLFGYPFMYWWTKLTYSKPFLVTGGEDKAFFNEVSHVFHVFVLLEKKNKDKISLWEKKNIGLDSLEPFIMSSALYFSARIMTTREGALMMFGYNLPYCIWFVAAIWDIEQCLLAAGALEQNDDSVPLSTFLVFLFGLLFHFGCVLKD